jgi:transcriptional regulator with XRE-family HTH domain/tetratricopeptide (TPR) repeat protein
MNDLSPARGTTLDGKKLRELRGQRALSQEDLAEIAGVSDDTISRAERGRSISFDNARAIAAAFNVDVASLLPAGIPSKKPPTEEARTAAMSNIPIRVPTHFMGRDAALAEIADALARYDGRVAITALHGLRGVGKTVLAAAYAERHAKDYRATWWLRAETESGLRADLVGLGVRLGWVDAQEKEEPALAAVMERLTQDGAGLLLIYDNAVAADAIRPYLPRGGAARVLVTSNAHAWRGIAQPVEIRLWPKEIGADFLVARTGRTVERTAAEALSEALGGLPLAHEQAAAYCERLEIALAEYARRFKDEPARLMDVAKDAPAEYHDKLTVAKTFALAIEAAAKLHPAAEPLIVLCSLLAPEPIPLLLLRDGREHLGEPLASALEGDGLDEAVAALRHFALVDREEIPDERDPSFTTDTIRLHRLVREVAAARRDAVHRDEVLRALISAIWAAYPRSIFDNPVAWRRARRLNALATPLAMTDPLPPGVGELSSGLLDRMASYQQYALVDRMKARSLFERALMIREQTFGPEHQETHVSRHNLAILLRDMGEFQESRKLFERSLEFSITFYGPEDPSTAISLNQFSWLLKDQGDFQNAQVYYKKALDIFIKSLGWEHIDTLSCATNLGSLLSGQNDLQTSYDLHKKVLDIKEKLMDEGHPSIGNSLGHLAVVCLQQRKFDEAEALLEKSVTILETALGPDHPSTTHARAVLETVAAARASDASHPPP